VTTSAGSNGRPHALSAARYPSSRRSDVLTVRAVQHADAAVPEAEQMRHGFVRAPLLVDRHHVGAESRADPHELHERHLRRFQLAEQVGRQPATRLREQQAVDALGEEQPQALRLLLGSSSLLASSSS
jgi:hypothetical protein